MCGIFAYSGSRDASETIINGLKRLEYRGYDSWGVAVKNGGIHVLKQVGAIGDITKSTKMPKSVIGVGHTRWATHGGVTEINAHPHYSTDESFILAQNGIVQNYQELKAELIKKGYKFKSETDTEVIVRLIEYELKTTKSLRIAVRKAFLRLNGRNTIIVLDNSKKDHIIAVRNGSPLIVGVGKDEFFFASDTLSFSDSTNKVIFLDDYDMAELIGDDMKIYSVKSGKQKDYEISKLDYKSEEISKGDYERYMLKEIVEQKDSIFNAGNYSEKDLEKLVSAIKKAKRAYTVGAGGACFAADQVAYFLRSIAGVNVIQLKAYEMSSYSKLFQKNDVLIAISQSGETADTIEAIEIARKSGVLIASAVNMMGSTITRLSDFPFYSRSGPEICVISTKSGSAQTTFGYTLAMTLIGKNKEAINNLKKLSNELDSYLSSELLDKTELIGEKLAKQEHVYLLGRGQNFVVAILGALNMKEASYIHAEGFSAGELKHGVIALISKGTPVIVFVSNDSEKEEMISAAAEVKARGAEVIGIAVENNELFDEFIPLPKEFGAASVVANIIPCQLLAYYIAIARGHDPDKPRNLAKSVTVK